MLQFKAILLVGHRKYNKDVYVLVRGVSNERPNTVVSISKTIRYNLLLPSITMGDQYADNLGYFTRQEMSYLVRRYRIIPKDDYGDSTIPIILKYLCTIIGCYSILRFTVANRTRVRKSNSSFNELNSYLKIAH